MISYGGGLLLVAGAVYVLFFSERPWLKAAGGAYLVVVLLLSVVSAFRSDELLKNLIVPGLIVFLVVFAAGIRRNWKDWP